MTFDFNHYHNICAATVASDDLFANFRREGVFFDMYEHVTFEEGLIYLQEIKKVPEVYNRIDLFASNDMIGNPRTSYYEEIGYDIAPTTLRFIKVLADLVSLFGSLDGMDIIEVGAGYGGQCKIIYDMFKPKSYTIVDLPYSRDLAKKFLKEFSIMLSPKLSDYDLFISNYAFTEIERKYQDVYYENGIKKSKRGYITCNFYEWYETEGMMNVSELLRMMPNSKVLEEIPLTAKDNFIYTWNNASI